MQIHQSRSNRFLLPCKPVVRRHRAACPPHPAIRQIQRPRQHRLTRARGNAHRAEMVGVQVRHRVALPHRHARRAEVVILRHLRAERRGRALPDVAHLVRRRDDERILVAQHSVKVGCGRGGVAQPELQRAGVRDHRDGVQPVPASANFPRRAPRDRNHAADDLDRRSHLDAGRDFVVVHTERHGLPLIHTVGCRHGEPAALMPSQYI